LAFLQGNGVVNEAGEWIWGDGHLVLNGDIVDRGEQVTELLWMIRRLEREAVRAGGRVHYVLGNHESMVMAGDLRYIHPKYRFTTDRIGSSYDDLHGPNSELGRWLRNHNSVIRVGPFLFVHAGYSPELDRLGLELDEINRTIRVGLGPPAWPTAAKADLRTGLIWHQQGPHWYRGYFPRHAADWGGRPSEEMIASILNRHGVKHIVVGHTVVDEVGRIDGRPELIGIDVAWRDPSEAAGLLHAEGRLYQVDASGQKTPLDSGQSPTSGK
jgi:UDP-2,3-diacylglucosamine pyrophosphatase LpxH